MCPLYLDLSVWLMMQDLAISMLFSGRVRLVLIYVGMMVCIEEVEFPGLIAPVSAKERHGRCSFFLSLIAEVTQCNAVQVLIHYSDSFDRVPWHLHKFRSYLSRSEVILLRRMCVRIVM